MTTTEIILILNSFFAFIFGISVGHFFTKPRKRDAATRTGSARSKPKQMEPEGWLMEPKFKKKSVYNPGNDPSKIMEGLVDDQFS